MISGHWSQGDHGPNNGTWYVYTWNGTNFTGTSTGIAVDSAATTLLLQTLTRRQGGSGRPGLDQRHLLHRDASQYLYGFDCKLFIDHDFDSTNVTNSSTEFIQARGYTATTTSPIRRFVI